MENGLQVTSKKFDEIENIYLLEFIDSDEKLFIIGEDSKEGNKGLRFIIWDLYNIGKVESTKLDDYSTNFIKNIGAYFTRTLGNILQIDDYGTVKSVLKKVAEGLKKVKKEKKEKVEIACPNIKLKKG